MKKIFAALLSIFSLTAFCEDSVICTIDGRTLKVESLTALPDSSLEYALPGSKERTRIASGQYVYARIPKPSEIEKADAFLKKGSFAQAAASYKLAYDKYKLLGWDLYCIGHESEALAGLGEKIAALKKLESVKDYKLQDRTRDSHLNYVRRLRARLCVELGKYKEAEPVLNGMAGGTDASDAAFAFIRKGDILRRDGKLKEASQTYLQASLLFLDVPERPEALASLYTVLKELKDSNAEKFAGILRSEYPENPWTKRIEKK